MPRRTRPVVAAAGAAAAVIAGGALWAVGVPGTAGASPAAGSFAADTTSLRASHGLGAYRQCADLAAIADSWAAHMAATHTLAHNPGLTSQVPSWRAVGENVGDGPDVSSIQDAFVASPPHFANLTSSSFVEVGYGTAYSSDGQLWVDEVFRLPEGNGCAPAAVVAPPAKNPVTVVVTKVVTVPARTTAPAPAATVVQPTRSQVRTTVQAPVAAQAPAAPKVVANPQVVRSEQAAAYLATISAGGAPNRDVVAAALAFARLMRVS